MSNKQTGLAILTNKLAERFDLGDNGSELVAVLKQTAFKGNASDAQITALMVVANQYGLNPWTREIYAFPDKNNGIVPVVGVDGWSRIINEHPQFDGLDFEQDDEKCTCIIHRKDRSRPIKVTEYMAECKRANAGPWQSHPKRMLRHKALIQCARLAFGYVGIFDEDEAERITERDVTPPRQPVVMPTPIARQEPIHARTVVPPRAEPVPVATTVLPEAETAPAPEIEPVLAVDSSYVCASERQIVEIRARLDAYNVSENDVCVEFFLEKLEQLPADRVSECCKFIKAKAAK